MLANTPSAIELDEAAIARVVDRFYGSVQRDAVIGPLFLDVVTDWPVHLERLSAF